MKLKSDDISAQPWFDYLAAKLPAWQAYRGGWSQASYIGNQTVENAYAELIAGPLDDVEYVAPGGVPANGRQPGREFIFSVNIEH